MRKLKIPTYAGVMALCLWGAMPASAQTALRLRVDNDAFNFWQPPWDRPDEEYSSGVRLSADYTGRAFWDRRAPGSATDCGAKRERCVEHTWTLSQEIYTPARRADAPEPPAGSRPDAGLLWLEDAERTIQAGRIDEMSLLAGVTGPPSLASSVQRIVHGYAPNFQRPIDWSQQLPFEPLLNASYDQRRRWQIPMGELLPHAGVSVGNLLTEARAGIGARGGWNVSSPFVPAAPRAPFEVAVVADATVRAVAWNQPLSGNLFRSSQSVKLRPLIAEMQLGMSAGLGRATVAFVAHRTGAEYTTRDAAHAWSTLEAGWRFGP